MAAAGPKGRDGPSPREFTTVRHFMMADLGLSGLPLLVYARIFGFCDAGCGYFESKGGLARFLNVQERSVHRAIRDLLDRGLIEECGVHAPARGHATKRYRIVRERLPPGALATPDGSSGFPARKGDEMTGFAENKGDEPSGFAARTPDDMPPNKQKGQQGLQKIRKGRPMDRAGLITLEQARAAGLSFDEPEPRACPHCGAALDPLGAALAGRVAWVSAAPCPCEGAASERESEARRRAALAAKEEAARREKALSRAGIPRRYWAAEADRPEFAEYIASFAGNGGAGLYIHGGVGAGKTHAASAMARLFAEAGYDVAFTTAKGMLERVKATFDEGGTEAAVARYAKCDVLVLDDLGKEDATEWSVGTVFSVLDARYEDMRPTIVTSNYAPGALADRLARRGERVTAEAIASRISQTCRTVYLGGRDRRRLG
ncbi:ATP-binding protein [Collinsella sp. TM09-10AT]|nr:ATP-binding protein [Collinsella sp. TM09-10AT]